MFGSYCTGSQARGGASCWAECRIWRSGALAMLDVPVSHLIAPPAARDIRLDLVRGWLQLTIFASHAVGSWIGTWLIHGAWGLSDSSEQFVFPSGFTLGSVFDYKLTRYGWRAATYDMLVRAARLYRTHLALLAAFATLILAVRLTPA